MGKARALKLGIVKGVQSVAVSAAMKILPTEYKCPICKHKFEAYAVAAEAKATGISAEQIVAGHIKDCIARMYPNQKSDCLMCKEKGTKFSCKISELDAHIELMHPEEMPSHTDTMRSDSTEVRTDSGDKSPVSTATARESENVDTGKVDD